MMVAFQGDLGFLLPHPPSFPSVNTATQPRVNLTSAFQLPSPPPSPRSRSLAEILVSNSDRRSMCSAPRFLGRRRSIHEILGGGIVADVLLWRRKNVTFGMLLGTLASCLVFEIQGYNLLWLVSNVLLLLFSILFLWAKAAGILNRPPPPIPDLQLSEEVINETANLLYSSLNMLLLTCHKIALGKDTKLFYKVATCLWLISLVGGFIGFLTMAYTSLVAVLTIPALYDKYEDDVDKILAIFYEDVLCGYESFVLCFEEFTNWILEKKKKLNKWCSSFL